MFLPPPLPSGQPSLTPPVSTLSHVKGLHVNMAFVLRNFYTLTLFLGARFQKFFGYTERDVELLFPLKEKIVYSLMRESGYMHIQSTKPDTVGERTGSGPAQRSAPPGGGVGGQLTSIPIGKGPTQGRPRRPPEKRPSELLDPYAAFFRRSELMLGHQIPNNCICGFKYSQWL